MKRFEYFGLLLFSLLLISCNDFKTTKDGVKYKRHYSGENQDLKPLIGDIMTLDVIFKNKDSIVNQFINTDIQLSKPMSSGDLWNGFMTMSKGDSTTFIITAKQFYNELTGTSIPNGVDNSAEIFVDVKMINFYSEADYLTKKTAEYEQKERESLNNYLTSNNVTVSPSESGMYFILLEKGNGRKAEAGKIIVVNYTGTFLNGRKFDSSYDRNEAFEFVLGEGQVIRAWDEAFAMMRVGDIATIIAPSKVAYGSQGVQVAPGKYMIEPYTPLLFDVHLIDVKDIDPKKVNMKKQ